MRYNRKCRSQGGFTLVELVMGMLIAGIILSAVAALSFAMGRGQEVTDLMIANQSMIRTLSIRLPELIRNGLMVWMADDGDLVIWAEDTNGNRQIEISELAWLIANTSGGRIEQLTAAGLNTPVAIAEILDGSAETAARAAAGSQVVPLVRGCSNIQFFMQGYRYVIVRFQLPEETGSRDYQVIARTRGDASAWIQGGVLVAGDDD